MKKKTVLLLYTNYSTFVAKDDVILKKNYNVIPYHFQSQKKLSSMMFEMFKQKIFLLVNIWKVDIVYSWFSDFHSFLPFLFAKMLGKKTVVIVGGFEGVKAYVPGLKAVFKSIPTGYNPDNWVVGTYERKKSVVAFGYAGNMQKFVGKGYDFIIEVAKKMPDIDFHLISIRDKMKDYANEIAPTNVTITDSLPQDKLLEELAKNKVYTLLSMSEGLPSSLCEAMLCG
ncbi:MAG: hypothetical protein B6I18_04940, partial [Bacteroidetes bacterium 4572_112]